MKKTLHFEVQIDENYLPLNIEMQASDAATKETDIKALMVSAWVAKNRETLRIDLWTKDMPVDEMKIFFHQTLVGMKDTYLRATQDTKMAETMGDFCDYFAEKLNLKQ